MKLAQFWQKIQVTPMTPLTLPGRGTSLAIAVGLLTQLSMALWPSTSHAFGSKPSTPAPTTPVATATPSTTPTAGVIGTPLSPSPVAAQPAPTGLVGPIFPGVIPAATGIDTTLATGEIMGLFRPYYDGSSMILEQISSEGPPVVAPSCAAAKPRLFKINDSPTSGIYGYKIAIALTSYSMERRLVLYPDPNLCTADGYQFITNMRMTSQ